MNNYWVAVIGALVVSLSAPFAVKPLLLHFGVIDVPNARSSHDRPAIRGAGIAPLLAFVVGYGILLIGSRDSVVSEFLLVIAGVAIAAGLLGTVEDIFGVRVIFRASLQLAIGFVGSVVVLGIVNSPWWSVLVFGLVVAAYINVANFMDGIDGISGFHGLVVGLTYFILGVIVDAPWLSVAGSILAVAFAGFLPWNLARGGIFLGDAGSYLLGGAVAIIAVCAFSSDLPAVAVIAPAAIYLSDTGITLARRVLRGEKWFESHRGHIYQRLTDLGFSHARVATIVTLGSALTGSLGLLAANSPPLLPLCLLLMAVIVMTYLSLHGAITALRARRSHGIQKRTTT